MDHLHTNEKKGFLEEASHLILVFYQNQTFEKNGQVQRNYYAKESVGIATGLLISALHQSSVTTLTYTPSRMKFMRDLLELNKSYLPFIMIVAGEAPSSLEVPSIRKKRFDEYVRVYN